MSNQPVIVTENNDAIKDYGIDDGHDAVKLVNGKTLYIPSRVISGHYPYLSVSNDENDSFLYEINGHKFTVIEKPSINAGHRFLQTRIDDFPYNELNLVLVYHALLRAGAEGKCNICTGLPFNQYYSTDGQKNRQLLDLKKNAFKSKVTAVNSDVKLEIVEHRVCAEGVAGYFDLKYNQDGTINQEFDDHCENGVICIVDIGGRTTDIVTFDNESIDFTRSNTVDIGGLWLKDNLIGKVKAKLDVNSIPDKMIDDIIRNDGLYPRKNIDVKDILDGLKKELADEIANNIKHNIKRTADISLIAFIGGGSLLLHKPLKNLYSPELAKFVKDPLHSNARGMLKLLKFGS